MLQRSWLRRLTGPRLLRAKGPLQLERLEERCVLSTIVGVTGTNALVRFDSSTPGTQTTIGNITGLPTGQSLVDIDFRPQTGELFGLGVSGTTGQLYKINPTTAVATAVGGPFSTTLVGANFGFDFDPVADQVRITSDANENLLINPTTGALISTNTPLTPSGSVVGTAYNNNFRGATQTTLYGYNTTTNNIVTIGSINGSPNSPDGGLIQAVGSSGVTVTAGSQPEVGFDIDANGAAYLNLVVGGNSGLYTANLSTGVVTLVGAFSVVMRDISVAPAVSYTVNGFPSPRTAGLASTVTVTAKDAYGLVATGYHGTVTFTSSDPSAILPAPATLNSGVGTASVTLQTPGTTSITATDSLNGTITGSQGGIVVLPNTELVGVTTANQLVRFNSATPGAITTIGTLTGVNAGQTIVGIDFRPSTGELYALGFGAGIGQIYKINPTTGSAVALGGPFSTTLAGTNFGFDFNPVADQIRITSDANENLLVSPSTGALISANTNLTPSGSVVGIAYNRNFLGAASTTLYGYNTATDSLVTIGSVNGTPNSPNTGILTSLGSSSVTTTSGTAGDVGFDIDANGAAYLNLVVAGNSGLFTANLSNGVVTSNGTFGSGVILRDVTVAPAVRLAFGNLGSTRIAGAVSPITVTAVDAYGNVAAGYQGTIAFSSSDLSARLPTNTTLTNGVGTFNVTFNTVGTQSLTATDTANNAITGTASVAVAGATDLVGLTSTNQLVRFNSATPNSAILIGSITGLAAGDTLVGLDFRPATGQLYGVGLGTSSGRIYRINLTTAVATQVGTGFSNSLTGTSYGVDFDPVADALRITSNTGQNLRVSPTTGSLISSDSGLTPPSVYTGIAYNNNILGATQTTLYAYDFTNNRLVTIGNIGGVPNSPNSGLVSVIGPSGVSTTSGTAGDVGFDIGGDGVAYLNLVAGGASGLYTANLSTGSVSLVGNFSGLTLVDVTEVQAASFLVTGFPSSIQKNVSGTFTVTALDPFGLTVTSYQGTVTFTSTDPAATLPADAMLTNGVGVFTATFRTVGTQSLSAIDTLIPTITGTQNGIVVTSTTIVTSGNDKIGVVRSALDRSATISLDSNGDGVFDTGDAAFTFGLATDKFITGDWAGLGFDSIGIVRATASGVAQFSLDSNGDDVFDTGDSVFNFGLNTDTFITGDWNGSGTTKIGVVRPGANGTAQFSLDTNGDGVFDSGDQVFSFGLNSDTFITGDWNGSGKTEIGIVRPGANGVAQFSLDTNGNGSFGAGDSVFSFGLNTDTFVVGDWNDSGTSKIGVVRASANGTAVFSLDTNGDGIFDSGDQVFNFGLSTDRFLIGNWQPPAALYSGAGVLSAQVQALSPNAQFVSTINRAIAAWQQAGLDPQSVARLENVHYSIGTLSNGLLGETSGNSIVLDGTAQGHGWSEGTTPQPGQMDLFTALAHEMGHELGLADQSTQQNDVMFESLLPGIRKTPTTQDVDAVFSSLGV